MTFELSSSELHEGKKKVMKQFSKSKLVATVATTGFVLALGFGIMQQHQNAKCTEAMNESKLFGEKSLSEKLKLQKQFDQTKSELTGIQQKNVELKKEIASEKRQLKETRTKAEALGKDNGRVKSLEKQLSESKKNKAAIEAQLAELGQKIKSLEEQNQSLDLVAKKAQAEAKKAKDDLALNHSLASNFRAEAHKGKKSKLTVLAKKTKKMVVGFDVPQSLGEGVKFQVKTPSGKKYMSGSDELKAQQVSNTGLIFASAGNPEMEVTKRIELTFKPKDKLEAGIYHIEIINGSTKVGTCQIALR